MYVTLIPAHELVKPEFRQNIGRMFNTPDFRHRAVMSIFPELPDRPRAGANILFRLENIPGIAPRFVIQSDISPDPDNLPRGAKIQEFSLPQPPAGVPVSFRLAINAIIRHGDGSITSLPQFGKILEEGEESLENWLSRKLSPALAQVQILNGNREILTETQKSEIPGGQKKIVIDLVDGVAMVDDPQVLQGILHKGVGRAKSYGCGLLSVKQL